MARIYNPNIMYEKSQDTVNRPRGSENSLGESIYGGTDFSVVFPGGAEETLLHKYDVRESDAYRNAYNLFSSLSDKQWLNRLLQIPNQYSSGSSSVLDDLGLTQDYETRLMQNYNAAITQIQNLVSEYYSYKNSLPTTQVQQAADAGVNLAVTGGINSSSLAGQQYESSPTSHGGTDVIGHVSNAVGAVSSVLSTVSSIYSSVQNIRNSRRQLDLNEGQFVSQFIKTMSDAGFTDLRGINSVRDIVDWWSNNNDPEIVNRRSDALVKALHTSGKNLMYQKYYNVDDNGIVHFNTNNLLSDATGATDQDQLDAIMNEYASYQMQSMLLDNIYQRNISSYNAQRSDLLDPEFSANAENTANWAEELSATYQAQRSSLQSQFVKKFAERFNNASSPSDRFALLEILFDMNLDDQVSFELINLLGSPTVAKYAEEVAGQAIDVAGKVGSSLSSLFKKKLVK